MPETIGHLSFKVPQALFCFLPGNTEGQLPGIKYCTKIANFQLNQKSKEYSFLNYTSKFNMYFLKLL